MDSFRGQRTSESKLPRLPRAIFDSRPARLVSRGEDAGDADPEHAVSCALAVHRQKTRSPASRVGRPSLRNGTQSRAVRRPHMGRSEVVPRFACSHPPRMAHFLRAASRLADSHSGSAQFRIGRLGSATIGNRAASKEGAGAEWLSRCRQEVNATCRPQRIRSEEGCTLLLCDRPVRPGTWMESTTYCLSGKEGFKVACTADMGEGLVGMAANGMLQTGFRILKRQARSSRYAFSGDNDLGLT